MSRLAVGVLLALICAAATGAERRSTQRAAFMRESPCPATGERRGVCPGYVVDHIRPLCDGGEDLPRNMQWQTTDDAKRKDKEERLACRERRRGDGLIKQSG